MAGYIASQIASEYPVIFQWEAFTDSGIMSCFQGVDIMVFLHGEFLVKVGKMWFVCIIHYGYIMDASWTHCGYYEEFWAEILSIELAFKVVPTVRRLLTSKLSASIRIHSTRPYVLLTIRSHSGILAKKITGIIEPGAQSCHALYQTSPCQHRYIDFIASCSGTAI